jgi:hypothetical protein
MVNWILIVVLVVAALIILKFKEIRHQAGIFIGLAVLVFLVLTFGRISLAYDVDLNTFDGFMHATKLYTVWLKQTFGNVVETTAYVVKQDWGLNTSGLNLTKP